MVSLGIFSVVPPIEPCALRSTQLLEVSTRDFFWGKYDRCVWLTTYHPCSAETLRNSGVLTYPEPLGPPRPVAGHKKKIILVFMYVVVIYDLFVNCNWVVTRWQQYGTHLHTNSTQNNTKQTIHRTTQNKQYTEQHNNLGECGPCPVLASYTLAFALPLRKKHGKTSVRVAASKNT